MFHSRPWLALPLSSPLLQDIWMAICKNTCLKFEIYYPVQSAGFDKSVSATYTCIYVYMYTYMKVGRHVYELLCAGNDSNGLAPLLSYLIHGGSQAPQVAMQAKVSHTS